MLFGLGLAIVGLWWRDDLWFEYEPRPRPYIFAGLAFAISAFAIAASGFRQAADWPSLREPIELVCLNAAWIGVALIFLVGLEVYIESNFFFVVNSSLEHRISFIVPIGLWCLAVSLWGFWTLKRIGGLNAWHEKLPNILGKTVNILIVASQMGGKWKVKELWVDGDSIRSPYVDSCVSGHLRPLLTDPLQV
jgi:hypothetical protein